MPHIRQVPRKGAPRWEAVWTDPQGMKHSALFQSEDAARIFVSVTPHRTRESCGRGPADEPLDQRIRRLSKCDENGCWIWQGTIMNSGYGQIGVRVGGGKQRTTGAHRVSYETFVGPIPEGLVIDHLCRVRPCVNPNHLDVVTNRENTMRSPIAIGRENALKTHCPHGHPYDDENTYWYRIGRAGKGRLCRTCQREHARRYRARRAAEQVAS